MRRILFLTVSAILALDVLVAANEMRPEERDAGAAAVAAAPAPTLTLPPTSTTTAPPPTTATPPTAAPPLTTTAPAPQGSGPVDVPADPYAAEEVRVIGTIEVPKLGLRAPLQQGVTLRNIDLGPSHWPGTAMPGQPGNVVVMGHRVTKTRPFRYIDTLVPGDEVFFEVGGVRTRYVMTGHEIVTPDRVDIVRQTAEATATLFACHPPGSARYRYVVRLKLQG